MTPRTFWKIFLKILGIYLIVDSFGVLLQSVFSMAYLSGPVDDWQSHLVASLGILITLGIYFVILRFCIFKTDWLIDKLKLDQGFAEEKLDLNINKSDALSIAVIIIGGLLFIDNIPVLCKQLFIFYQEESLSGRFGDKPSTNWLIFAAVKTFTGYFIVDNHRKISAWFIKSEKDNNSNA